MIFVSIGTELTTQIIQIHEAVKKIPGRESTTTHELLFRTDSIPPMGFKSFYVELVKNKSASDHLGASKKDATSFIIGDPVCMDFTYYSY